MRLSVRKDDPGYHPLYRGSGVRVLLDGIERSHIITADEKDRTLLRYVTPLRVNAARDGAETELLTGDVVILVPPESNLAKFDYIGGKLYSKGVARGGPVRPVLAACEREGREVFRPLA